MTKHILVIGSGGIAERHINNFYVLFPEGRVTLVKRKNSNTPLNVRVHEIIHDFVDAAARQYDAAIIASPSPMHRDAAVLLLKQKIPVFIEKPLAHEISHAKDILDVARENIEAPVIVGYCLRYSESLKAFKKLLDSAEIGIIRSAQIIMEQYLPEWRPAIDYKDSVSAQSKLGGGVLLELSHEIDYIDWLFGEVVDIFGFVKIIDDLEMDVENLVELVMSTKQDIIVSAHLNMLARRPTRTCKVLTSKGWAEWDFINNKISWEIEKKGVQELNFPIEEKQMMYLNELKHFFHLINEPEQSLVSVENSYRVIETIEKIRSL